VLIGLAGRLASLRRYPSRLSNGTTLYLDLSQRMCHGLFFMRGQPHEYGTEKILRSLLGPGDTFVDVGANVGFYTVLAEQIVGRDGTVIAIEPQPAALSALTLNAHARPQVIVVPAAASDHRGKATFYARHAGDTSSLTADEAATPIQVDVDTLDNICSQLSCLKLIKIDVEGHEPEVLRGARATISKHRPWVCFEILDEMVTTGRVDVQEIAAFFRDLKYACHWVSHDSGEALISDHRSTYVLATPHERLSQLEVDTAPAF